MCDKKLEELARKMALNLIHVTLDENDAFRAIETVIDNSNYSMNEPEAGNFPYKPERFVVVVGAGASFNANPGLKLASEAADEVTANLTKNNEYVSELLGLELDRLEAVYKLNREEFETRMLALSRFYPKERVTNEIYEIYNHRHSPSLFYELLAHMFKHRFIDVIINFNFDETLDQAIEDEMSQGDYYEVISDGDSPNEIEKLMVANRFKQPLYIKPHGTVSHKATLRFTREDYFGLPTDINKLLKEILSGRRADKDKNKIPVNLIVVGFQMQSIEFNNIVKEHLPEGSEIFFLKLSKPKFDTRELKTIEKKYYNGGFFSVKSSSKKKLPIVNCSGLDMLMFKLWEAVRLNFKKEYRPRSIARHELIAELFSSENRCRIGDLSLEDYIRDRTFVELSLSIAKSKGFLTISQLNNDRTGIYYKYYKRNIIERGGDVLTLGDFCREIGLHEVGYSSETFKLEKELTNNPNDLIVKRENFLNAHIDLLFDKLVEEKKEFEASLLSALTRARLKQIENKYKAVLRELYDGDASEICSKLDNIYNNIFSKPTILCTKLALKYHTDKLLYSDDWDISISVAETAEWLYKKNIPNLDKKKMMIIVADSNFCNKLMEKFRTALFAGYRIEPNWLNALEALNESKRSMLEELLEPSVDMLKKAMSERIKDKHLIDTMKYEEVYNLYVIPWWLHNHHMSIFFKRNKDGKIDIKKSIYFTNRLRLSNMNPVLLDESDSRVILESAIAYKLIGANRYKYNGNATPIFSRFDILREILKLQNLKILKAEFQNPS